MYTAYFIYRETTTVLLSNFGVQTPHFRSGGNYTIILISFRIIIESSGCYGDSQIIRYGAFAYYYKIIWYIKIYTTLLMVLSFIDRNFRRN